MGIPVPKILIYLDSADLSIVRRYASQVQGFTTNPTLMRQAGATDYEAFIREMLSATEGKDDKPISMEVIADTLAEMEAQARELSRWSRRVVVKIPITTTKGESTRSVLRNLFTDGILVNVTAVMTEAQVDDALHGNPFILSLFAGRIADTGRNPCDVVRYAVNHPSRRDVHLLWASAREVLNVQQAQEAGCDIITLTPALLDKLSLQGKDLTDYSRETVQMFYTDACLSGLRLGLPVK